MGSDDGTKQSRNASTLLAIPLGAVFGVAMHRSGVTSPENIMLQMTFQRLIMLKMFMAAGGTSALVFALWKLALGTFGSGGGRRRGSFQVATADFTSGLKDKSVAAVVAGAALLGAGMSVAGACPGMVLIQVGSGVQNSMYTFAGCIVGALLATVGLHNADDSCSSSSSSGSSGGGGKGNAAAADADSGLLFDTPVGKVLLGAALFSVAIGADIFRPWTDDVDGGSPFYISPVIAGVVVGVLQLPAVGLFQDTLGSATSYVHALSYVCPHAAFEKYQKPDFSTAWQLPYVLGAIAGGFASAVAAGNFGVTVGPPPLQSFVGGLLLIFGSRVAGGCTSGHGLSGLAIGAPKAWVAVPAMFGGGIATAFAMKAAGILVNCTENCAW